MDYLNEKIDRVVELYSVDEVNEYISNDSETWRILCVTARGTGESQAGFVYCLGRIYSPEKDFLGEQW